MTNETLNTGVVGLGIGLSTPAPDLKAVGFNAVEFVFRDAADTIKTAAGHAINQFSDRNQLHELLELPAVVIRTAQPRPPYS